MPDVGSTMTTKSDRPFSVQAVAAVVGDPTPSTRLETRAPIAAALDMFAALATENAKTSKVLPHPAASFTCLPEIQTARVTQLDRACLSTQVRITTTLSLLL